MSGEQAAEVVRRTGELFGRAVSEGEVDAYADMLDPEVDFEAFSVAAGHIVRFRGREEVRAYVVQTAKRYDELRLDVSELRDLGDDRFLVLGRWHGQIRGVGPFGAPLASIIQVRDGLLCRVNAFMDERDALEAV